MLTAPLRCTLVGLFLGVTCFLLMPARALCQCSSCPIPSWESSDPYTSTSNQTAVLEYFEQTIGNSGNPAFDADGHEVEEMAGTYQGTNACWFQGSYTALHPTVSGGSWFVGANYHNEWGPDEIGLPTRNAEQIWQEYEFRGISLPCTITVYQDMEIECNANLYWNYEDNIPQHTTVNTNDTLKACRQAADVCGPDIPIP